MVGFVFCCVIFSNVILLAKSWPSTNRSLHDHEFIPDSKLGNKDIFFPDEFTTQFRTLSSSKEESDFSAAGKGLNCIEGICDEAKDYPYDRIQQVIGKINVYNKLFNTLEGSIVELPSRAQPGEEDDSTPLCATLTHTVYPKQMKNEDEIERFIVNVEGHRQGLVFETCVENAECNYKSLLPAPSKCTQRYARRKMMALIDGNPAFDTFIVPSCCLCTIQKKT